MLEALYEKFGVTFKSSQIIFCEHEPGEDCYFILKGKVKITKTVGTTQKTLDVIDKGNFFGEMAILETEPRSASAIAAEDIRALKFNRVNFDMMIHKQPQLALKLMFSFCGRIHDARRRLQILHIEDPQVRVSDVFVMLAEKDPRYGKVSRMNFSITVNDVASWGGLPVGDVQRVMNIFVRRDKIEIYADHIVIHNINDFSRLVTYHRKNINA